MNWAVWAVVCRHGLNHKTKIARSRFRNLGPG
jgi:hypothetical protein